MLEHRVERFQFFDFDDREQLGARHQKMFAEMIDDDLARFLQLGVEQVGDERHATAATSAGSRATFHRTDRVEISFADRVTDRTFADVVARANLCLIRHRIDTAECRSTRLADQQLVRLARQRLRSLREDRERAVFARIADQNAAEQLRAIQIEQQLLVDATE